MAKDKTTKKGVKPTPKKGAKGAATVKTKTVKTAIPKTPKTPKPQKTSKAAKAIKALLIKRGPRGVEIGTEVLATPTGRRNRRGEATYNIVPAKGGFGGFPVGAQELRDLDRNPLPPLPTLPSAETADGEVHDSTFGE